MKSPDELRALSTINPELDHIIKTGPPFASIDTNTNIHSLRAHLASVKKRLTDSAPAQVEVSYEEKDIQIPVRDGFSIGIRLHRPKTLPNDGCPGLVLYHGGGWCLGGLDNESMLCRRWTEMGGIAINVDYRLAPEHPFPIAVNDAFDALKWTASHTEELNINPKKGFLIGGISAGANLAAVISHLYNDESLSPPLTGLYLAVPPLLEPEACPEKYKNVYLSREHNKTSPVLSSSTVDFFNQLYKANTLSPLRSPILFPSHANQPPSYFQICGLDPLRDEGFIYEDVLRESGVRTKVDVYKGLPHGFWSWFPEAEFSKGFWRDFESGLRWLLEG